jgi:hypothetical protein
MHGAAEKIGPRTAFESGLSTCFEGVIGVVRTDLDVKYLYAHLDTRQTIQFRALSTSADDMIHYCQRTSKLQTTTDPAYVYLVCSRRRA